MAKMNPMREKQLKHQQKKIEKSKHRDMLEVKMYTDAVSRVTRSRDRELIREVLQEVFGFGEKRIQRFEEALDAKAVKTSIDEILDTVKRVYVDGEETDSTVEETG